MKKSIIYFTFLIILIFPVLSYSSSELTNEQSIFRVLDNHIITTEGDFINYYNQEGTLINSVNVSPENPLDFLKYGVPSYDCSSCINTASRIGIDEFFIFTTNKENTTVQILNVSETIYDLAVSYDYGVIELLGITEDYYLINFRGSNLYSIAMNKSNISDITYNTFLNPSTNNYIETTDTLILPTPQQAGYSVYYSHVPYYEDGVYYNYLEDRYFAKAYPIFYDNDDIYNRILTQGRSLEYSTLGTSILSSMISSDNEYYFVGSDNHNSDFLRSDYPVYRSMKINIKENTFTVNEFYNFINSSGDNEQIEEGVYIENGVYRLTHDNKGNIVYTINDVEPENFYYDLQCENSFCHFGKFNLLENGNIVYYNSTDSKSYLIDGAPSTDNKPSIKLFGNLYPPEYNTEYKNFIPEWLILKNSSSLVTFPYDYTIGDYNIDNPPEINTEKEIYKLIQTTEETANEETNFIIQSSDLTNDEINIAYDCSYNEVKYIGDSDNYNYGLYELFDNHDNTTCGIVQLQTPDIVASNYINNTHGLIFDKNCEDNISLSVNTYSNEAVTYISNIMIGEGKGLTYVFYNKYDDEVLSLTLQHVKNGNTNYAYIKLNDEVIYNTTSVNNIVNYNRDLFITIEPTKTTYNIDGLVTGQKTNVVTLPIKRIEYKFLPKTNTTATPDNVVIGSWVLLNEDFYPSENEGVTSISLQDGNRYYTFSCDYSLYDSEEKTLRVYYDDTTINFNRYKDYNIVYESSLIDYDLPITQIEGSVEEEKIEERQSKSKTFYCEAINICDDHSRMFLAVVILILVTVSGAVFTYRKYENTLASQLVPAVLFSVVFVYFASIGFLQTWFIVITLIMIIGYLSLAFNPMRRMG